MGRTALSQGFFARSAIVAVLVAAYVAATLAPLVLAWRQDLPRRPFIDEFSSAVALAGFAMLLMEFVLSGRFRIFSAGIGIDLAMRMHQLLARTLLVFVLLHPFLYSLPYAGHGRPDPARLLSVTLTPAATVTGSTAFTFPSCCAWAPTFRSRVARRTSAACRACRGRR